MVWIASKALNVGGQSLYPSVVPNEPLMYRIAGEATNGLQPIISIGNENAVNRFHWAYEINYFSQTKFSRYDWLRTTNRVGARLELRLKDGQKVPLNDPDSIAATKLPHDTTVNDIKRGVQSRRYSWLWLHFEPSDSKDDTTGYMAAVATYNLKTAFGLTSFTNDMVLQITPLLYRVDTNMVDARLVEFPPIKLKLLTDGTVEKVGN